MKKAAIAMGLCAVLLGSVALGQNLSRTNHYVPVVSTVPSMQGQTGLLYVRQVSKGPVDENTDLDDKIVLFIHGAGTPAEVGFDVPVAGYSWMGYLAERGFQVFSMDMTGYGPSSRPFIMNDRCNLSQEQQMQEFGNACPASYPDAATTMATDWNDIDAVVEWLKSRYGVERVHLVGWSQGGPRSAGYAALHPENIANVVILAPAYNRAGVATAAEAPIAGDVMTKQSRADFIANWDRQVGCEDQYDPRVADAVWADMLASDPVGATWGNNGGVRRAPRVPTFGWTQDTVKNTHAPMLLVAGTHDGQVNPERVREMYADLGSEKKVYVEMHCSSHNAMWERDAEQLFDATYQWLSTTLYEGKAAGTFDLE
jgi:pimeloyl-ACP methyl ester carboxylesterase